MIRYNNNNIHLTALCPGLPRWASTRKVKQIFWILLKQETRDKIIVTEFAIL